jgi:hypothetical protein
MASKKQKGPTIIYGIQIRIDYQFTPKKLFKTEYGAQSWALLKIQQLEELGLKGIPFLTKEVINE